jgi:DNA-binding transcriptional regulator YiaG
MGPRGIQSSGGDSTTSRRFPRTAWRWIGAAATRLAPGQRWHSYRQMLDSVLSGAIIQASMPRPRSRPSALTPEERLRAQQATIAWREQAALTSKQIALRLRIGYSTYRSWEVGRGPRDGPTRGAAAELDRLLQHLLGEKYHPGDVLRVWGWSVKQQLDLETLKGILHDAGVVFDPPNLENPSAVLWCHTLRRPNLVHAVFSLVAAACARDGLTVRLLIDDTAFHPGRIRSRDQMRSELESAVQGWFRFARGDLDSLSSSLYSEMVHGDSAEARAWQAVNQYLQADQSQVIDYLLASRAIDPARYAEDREAAIATLMQDNPTIKTRCLLTPLWNWVVLEEAVRQLAGQDKGNSNILTLGGMDERIVWNLWHAGCSDEIGSRVRHLYLRVLPLPRYRRAWDEPVLDPRTTTARDLANFLRHCSQGGDLELLYWFQAGAVVLPATLNDGFGASVPRELLDGDAFRMALRESLAHTISEIAKVVHSWFVQ